MRLWTASLAHTFQRMDGLRHLRGHELDRAGFAPTETPYRELHSEPGLRLRHYEGGGDGPPLLIVPAPIKRAYIWDLAPQVSVVQRCLESGMQVYMAEWMPTNGDARHFGLADYGSRLLRVCHDAIAADSGSRALRVAGHSMGGILAAVFACRHPQAVHTLALLDAPLHFGPGTGDFAPMVAAIPGASALAEGFGHVPGSFLNMVCALAAPHVYQWERALDRHRSADTPAAMDIHMRVERWSCDEFAMPGKLFGEAVDHLYRDDALLQGQLEIDGRCIGPADLQARLLTVYDPRSTLIPPAAVLPFHEAAASEDKLLLSYHGDVGVALQHVGVLVGRNAHAQLWPQILAFMNEDAGQDG
jgi:polyhydroxyalkanoate synthase